MKQNKGFTLIELLIVVVILGVLASLTVPRLAGRTEKAKIKAAQSEVKGGVALALDLYEADMGRYPKTLTELVETDGKDANWDGPYIKTGLPKDPWRNPYVYRYPGERNKKSYDLLSTGPDGQNGTADDIANWEDK